MFHRITSICLLLSFVICAQAQSINNAYGVDDIPQDRLTIEIAFVGVHLPLGNVSDWTKRTMSWGVAELMDMIKYKKIIALESDQSASEFLSVIAEVADVQVLSSSVFTVTNGKTSKISLGTRRDEDSAFTLQVEITPKITDHETIELKLDAFIDTIQKDSYMKKKERYSKSSSGSIMISYKDLVILGGFAIENTDNYRTMDRGDMLIVISMPAGMPNSLERASN